MNSDFVQVDSDLAPVPEPTARFRHDLLTAGLLIDLGMPGLYGFSATFESIASAVSAMVADRGADQHAQAWRFPAVYPRAAFERTGYLKSFPNLIGMVQVFTGGDQQHQDMLAQAGAAGAWTQYLEAGRLALCSAACHPLYPLVEPHLPAGGKRYDVLAAVFRNEPSTDPARMQTFRMHEFVYVGEPDAAVAHRDNWLDRASGLLSDLGLEVAPVVANDPFFGRSGRLLTSLQRSEVLKYELVATVGDDTAPTAIASSNLHKDHFGAAFNIRTAGGEVAHSACFGFGLERVTLALIRAHGISPAQWPAGVRDALWP